MNTKIKILFAIGRLTVGGGEKLLVYQLKYLDREKFEPHLLTLFPEKEESFESLLRLFENVIARSGNDEAIRRWKQLNFRGLFDIFSWFKLWRFLRKEKFDVVVTSLFSANLMVRLALLFSGRPRVLISYEHNIYPDKHLWQIWADWFLAKFTAQIIVDAESVKRFTAKQEGIPLDKFLVMYIPPLAEATAADRQKIVIARSSNDEAISQRRREVEIASRHAPLAASASVARNDEIGFLDSSTLDNLRKEFGINPGDKVILTVSRLVEEKGHKYLIEAAKKVIAEYPNAKFLIVGWGPLKEELEKEIRLINTSDRVKMSLRGVPSLSRDDEAISEEVKEVEIASCHASLAASASVARNDEKSIFVRPEGLKAPVVIAGRRDIAEVLPLADIYAEPALFVDIGIASMEAMAAGLPIISTNVGEMPVFVKDGENGFLVPPADSSALAEKILTLLKNDDLRKKMGEKSRERVKEFSMEKYMQKFEELIFSILNSEF